MKKIFTLLSAATFAVGLNAQVEHTFEQFSNGEVWNTSTPLCQSTTPGEGSINHDSRVYDLSTYGITGDFTITKVDFVASATAGTAAWVEVAEVNGEYTEANMTVGEGYGDIVFADTPAQWNQIELIDTQTIPGGGKFAVAVAYEFVNGGTRLWFGNNDTSANPESSPSYIGWPGSDCVGTEPTPVADLGFPVSWLLSVTGTTSDMGVVELNSKSLSVYPNPATDVLNISLKNGEVKNVEITNLAGQNVLTSKSVNSVNVSFLPAGVYVVRVKDNNGTTHMSKIVKK